MPCSDGYSSHGGIDHASAARADKNARVACEALRMIEKYIPAYVSTLSSETQSWWVAHQEADRRREAAERERERRELTRQDALAKLTPEERKALGL